MPRTLIVVPAAHTWFFLQTCITSLRRYMPRDADILVVYNSPWCPAIRGITDTRLGDTIHVVANQKANQFHASALDYAVELYGNDYDFLMAWETDVLALQPDWLEWFHGQMKSTDYAVGHWHHEQFVNPSCTLYRMSVVLEMMAWCKTWDEKGLRWGENFDQVAPLDQNIPPGHPALDDMLGWVVGPFADKRGFPSGTKMPEHPSGQLKGGGWYEPGQMLHHWAVLHGHTYTVCPVWHYETQPGLPVQTVYGINDGPAKQMEFAELAASGGKTVHLWGGTRALDILKHPVECNFVRSNTPFWLAREARFWKDSVAPDIQEQTLDMIRKYGWHYKGCGTAEVTDRDREAAKFVQQCYLGGGVEI